MPSCPKCRRDVGEWKFCRYCGQALTSEAPADQVAGSDYLPADLLARAVGPREMRGLLSKTLVVEEGQLALLLVEGQNDATLGPGKHAIGNILTSRGRNTSVVLFRISDVSLETSVSGLMTSDPLPLAMDFRVTLKVETPLLLLHNLMSGAESYSVQNLAGALYPLLDEGCESFVGSRSIKDLDAHQDARGELQVSLSSHLQQPLARWGLTLLMVQAVRIRSEVWDKLTESRADYFVAASEEEAELEGRKRLFDVYHESELQELAQETAKVVGVEKRVGLWKRLRQALQANARDEIRSEAELENMVRDADKERLLKDDERESLIRTVAEAKEDHQKARAFALTRVEAEGEFELKKLGLGHRFGLEQERLALEVSTAREEMEAQSQLELRRLDLEITRERRLAEFRREEEAETQEAGRRSAVGEARTEATMLSGSAVGRGVSWHFWESLAQWDAAGTLAPDLADSWTIREDSAGAHYTFVLRDGRSWHEGGKPLPSDVEASLIVRYLASDRSFGPTIKGLFQSFETVDDDTFIIHLSKATGLLMMAYGYVGGTQPQIMPQDIAEEWPDTVAQRFNASGPYRFVSWDPGNEVVIDRYDAYVPRTEEPSYRAGAKMGYFARMITIEVPDQLTRVAAVLTGEVDSLDVISSDFYDIALKNSDRVAVHIGVPGAQPDIGFNLGDPLLGFTEKGRLMRLAIRAAIDAEEIMTGYGDPSLWTLCPALQHCGVAWQEPSTNTELYNENNPAKAKLLLEQAGYAGE